MSDAQSRPHLGSAPLAVRGGPPCTRPDQEGRLRARGGFGLAEVKPIVHEVDPARRIGTLDRHPHGLGDPILVSTPNSSLRPDQRTLPPPRPKVAMSKVVEPHDHLGLLRLQPVTPRDASLPRPARGSVNLEPDTGEERSDAKPVRSASTTASACQVSLPSIPPTCGKSHHAFSTETACGGSLTNTGTR